MLAGHLALGCGRDGLMGALDQHLNTGPLPHPFQRWVRRLKQEPSALRGGTKLGSLSQQQPVAADQRADPGQGTVVGLSAPAGYVGGGFHSVFNVTWLMTLSAG